MIKLSIFTLLSFMIYVLPSAQQKCSKDDYLECKCNKNEIDCSFGHFAQLNFNELSTLKANFSNNHLKTIDFGGNEQQLNLKILDLSFNKITHIETFEVLSNLRELSLAYNQIEHLNELAFDAQIALQILNMSHALNNTKFRLKHHLCHLYSLRILDLSGLDLSEFSLECHDSGVGHEIFMYVEELYLDNTKNVDKSWPKWFKFLGNSLKILSLKNSDIQSIDAHLYMHTNLKALILSGNHNLNKTDLLKIVTNMTNLNKIELNDLNLTEKDLTLERILSMPNLKALEVSSNNYDIDIGIHMEKICTLKSFNGANNLFKISPLKVGYEQANIEYLDLSTNLLNATILYELMNISTLRRINLSNNQIEILWSEFVSNNLVDLFKNKINITHVDLSFNRLIYFATYFKSNSIDSIDFSHNSLKNFQILPLEMVEKVNFPLNIDEYFNENLENLNKKYLSIKEINLSNNHFKELNIHTQLSSLKYIQVLDLSFNFIQKVIGLSSHGRKHTLIKTSDSNIEWNQSMNTYDNNENISLCIKELYLDHTRLTSVPSLELTCLSKLSISNALLKNTIHLELSKYTMSTLKYINLEYNDITGLEIAVNEGGSVGINSNNHTFIGLLNNPHFKCDCDYLRAIEEHSLILKIIDECNFDLSTNKKCYSPLVYPIDISKLFHKRLVFLLGIILVAILTLISLICYSIATDKSFVYGYLDFMKRKWSRLKERFTRQRPIYSGTRIPYVKLDRTQMDNVSSVEIVI